MPECTVVDPFTRVQDALREAAAERDRLRAIIDAAIADLEAGIDAQWPSRKKPTRDHGWMLFATALDHLRDAHRPPKVTPTQELSA